MKAPLAAPQAMSAFRGSEAPGVGGRRVAWSASWAMR